MSTTTTPVPLSPAIASATISNSTGQYWLGNVSHQTIECDPQNGDCYILCSAAFSCSGSVISCHGDACNMHIQCSETHSCLHLKIAASNADKVSFLCHGSSSCASSIIECASTCNIECMRSSACEHMVILASPGLGGQNTTNDTVTSTVELRCSADWRSCFAAQINISDVDVFNLRQLATSASDADNDTDSADNITSTDAYALQDAAIHVRDIDTFTMTCGALHGCDGVSVELIAAQTATVQCVEYASCNAMALAVWNSSQISLSCEESYACNASWMNITHSNSVRVDVSESMALTHATLDVHDCVRVSLYCSAHDEYACHELDLYVPSADTATSTALYCELFGCGELNIYANTATALQTVTVDMDLPCNCSNIADCVAPWNIYCDAADHEHNNATNNASYSVFDGDGDECDDTCCANLVQHAQATFDAYQEDMCMNMSMSTTLKPSDSNSNRPSSQWTWTQIGKYTGIICGTALLVCCMIYVAILCQRQRRYNQRYGFVQATQIRQNMQYHQLSHYRALSDNEEDYMASTYTHSNHSSLLNNSVGVDIRRKSLRRYTLDARKNPALIQSSNDDEDEQYML